LPDRLRGLAVLLMLACLAACELPARLPLRGEAPGREELWVVARDATTARRITTLAAPAILGRPAGSPDPPALLDLTRSDVGVTVVGPLVSVTGNYRYAVPKGSADLFVAFTPPPTPARQDLALRLGRRLVRVIVREPEEAARAQERARRDGQTTTLLTTDAAGRVLVPLGAAGSGTVELAVETVRIAGWHDGVYEVTVPRVPEGDATLAVDLHGAGPVVVVNSPSHTIDAQTIALDHLRITLQEPATLHDEDFVLRYRVDPTESPGVLVAQPDAGGTLVALLVHPQEDDLEPVALANVTIDWGAAEVSEVRPPAIGTIARGTPLVVLARVRGGYVGPATVTARASGRPRTFSLGATASPPADGLHALRVLWARAAPPETVASR
ncbi:MAG: hypothetical protein ACREQL_10290, partial [Candidatus Binatia bacterium]